jgi:hypothetical protein
MEIRVVKPDIWHPDDKSMSQQPDDVLDNVTLITHSEGALALCNDFGAVLHIYASGEWTEAHVEES